MDWDGETKFIKPPDCVRGFFFEDNPLKVFFELPAKNVEKDLLKESIGLFPGMKGEGYGPKKSNESGFNG
jgi:hypothetical protein